MTDDEDVVGKDLIAVGVVEMEVRVHDVADGFVGEGLDLGDQRARRGRRHVRIDEKDFLVIDNHAGVAAGVNRACCDGPIQRVGHLGEPMSRLGRCLQQGQRRATDQNDGSKNSDSSHQMSIAAAAKGGGGQRGRGRLVGCKQLARTWW